MENIGFLWHKDHFEFITRPDNLEEYHLLILEVHSLHLTLEFLEYGEKHKIEVLRFPGHSTNLLKALDVGIFGPLGTYYSQEVDQWSRTHSYRSFRNGDFFLMCHRAR
jgi:hypothetical protein